MSSLPEPIGLDKFRDLRYDKQSLVLYNNNNLTMANGRKGKKMKEFNNRGRIDENSVDIFLSNEEYKRLAKRFTGDLGVNEEIISYLCEKVDDLFREDKKFKEYIETYSKLFGLKNFALLEAEVEELISFDQGYRDGKRIKRVQSWIDKHDGKYACLFIGVYGISEAGLKSAKSLLFIPDHGVSDRVFYLRSPIYGIIDGYFIESSLKELEGLKGLPLDKIESAIKEKRRKEWMRVSEIIGGCSK